MPDISMCINDTCPVKDKCYRYTAEPAFMQTYSSFVFKEKCDYFWDNEPYRRGTKKTM